MLNVETLRVTLVAAMVLLAAQPAHADGTYGADFRAHLLPEAGTAHASITITQEAGELKRLDLAAPAATYSAFSGPGSIRREEDRLVWTVPEDGGTLSYDVLIDHRRNGAYDARMTPDWAIARLDDLFPRARTRSESGAQSRSSVVLAGPAGWRFETRYGPSHEQVAVVDEGRRFDRPTGWLVAGRLGIRRDTIAGRTVSVAAPVGQGFRRVDVLAFLRWTLPDLVAVFPGMPDRLLVVGAPEGMWRGGLSGPESLYLHVGRPLISENGTSTLLHELVHIATTAPKSAGDDWIREGLAEYYSLETLRRSGGISEERFASALGSLAAWAQRDGGRLADPSTGAHTARAALTFHELAAELEDAGSSLDAVVGELVAGGSLDRGSLLALLEPKLTEPSGILAELPR
jgi:hypothetical protein